MLPYPQAGTGEETLLPDGTGTAQAGGGGFLMFYAGDKKKLRHAMREKGLQEVRFRFDFEGSKVVAQN